jgi:hypothetical protein
MRAWLTARLIRAMDHFAYWLLADQSPAIISGRDPRIRSDASE